MKKLIFILFLIIPTLSFSQNRITLKSGDSFIAKIYRVYGKNLIFYDDIPGTDTDRVNINSVESIAGKMPGSRIKEIFKQNPYVLFLPGEFTKEDVKDQPAVSVDNSYLPYGQGGKAPNQTYTPKAFQQLSAGDLVKRSGYYRLTGFAIGTGVSTLALAGTFKKADENTLVAIVGISSAVALGFYLAGEFTLIKAGKKMNSDAVTISAAKSGIGLAINF